MSESFGFEPGYEYAFLETPVNDDIFVQLGFLRRAPMFTGTFETTVGEDMVAVAREAFFSPWHGTMSTGIDVVSVAYSRAVHTSELQNSNVDIICEDPRLSMPGPGRRCLVITMDTLAKKSGQSKNHYLLGFASTLGCCCSNL